MEPRAYSYIRFSTPGQEEGDSLRRQVEGSQRIAAKLGLALDDTLKLEDRGLSGYKGDHRTKGALGGFLRLVEGGKIQPSSLLILEHLDRLTREGLLEAIHLLTGILLKGIDLYTVMDDKLFTKSKYDLADLIISATTLQQGHEESEKKSKRLKEAWNNKRNNINQKVLTNRCPAWLRRSEDWSCYEAIPERVEIIKQIFQMKVEGVGVYSIEKRLNESAVWKPTSPRTGIESWRKSYINKILRNPAVIGEYQPHVLKDGTRQPTGDPILDYFPRIVDPAIFYAVQQQIKTNGHSYAGGRNGKLSNLFSHIARCGYCGSPMYFINKGRWSYLVCDNANRRLGCNYISWSYPEFEADLLRLISQDVDVTALLPDHEQVESEIDRLKQVRSSNGEQLGRIESEIENLSNAIADASDKRVRDLLQGKLTNRLDEKERLLTTAEEVGRKIEDLQKSDGALRQRIADMRELMAFMEKANPGERTDIRLRLREALRNTIDEIRLFPGGFKDKEHVDELITDKAKRFIYYQGINNKAWRFFEVKLKGCRSFSRGFLPDGTFEKLKEIDDKRRGEGFFPELVNGRN